MWPLANSDPSIAPLRSHQINSLCVTHSLLVRGFDLFSANDGQMLLVKKEFSDLITVDVNSWSTRLFICRDSHSSRSAKSFLASELGRILALSILRTWFLFVCAREMSRSRCRLMLSRCWKLPPNCHNVSHYTIYACPECQRLSVESSPSKNRSPASLPAVQRGATSPGYLDKTHLKR